ncbi:Leucine-rich repeat serine/threonine-protein kinase 2 [Rhizoclosmatium hyalinum]|nr:Leucine-rich repeat serine/threonine-protein kinase 2 [Rhizoclosmatium hyalinum]
MQTTTSNIATNTALTRHLEQLHQRLPLLRRHCDSLVDVMNQSTDVALLVKLNNELGAAEAKFNECATEIQRIESMTSLLSFELASSPSPVPSDDSLFSDSDSEDWDVFISYCWLNSAEAQTLAQKDNNQDATQDHVGKCDPRELNRILKKRGFSTWLDVDRMTGGDVLPHQLMHGISRSKFAIVCVSDEYVRSPNCQKEFKYLSKRRKIPHVIVVVGHNKHSQWDKSGIGLMDGSNLWIGAQGPKEEELPEDIIEQIISAVRRHVSPRLNIAASAA